MLERELVQLGFALDCHDREVLAHVAAPRDLVGTDIQQLTQRAVAACLTNRGTEHPRSSPEGAHVPWITFTKAEALPYVISDSGFIMIHELHTRQ